MNFKKWLSNKTEDVFRHTAASKKIRKEAYQQVFPFASEEEPPDVKRIQRFKNQDNYVRAMSKGGRNTEKASRALISLPVSSGYTGQEEILSIHPSALTIPEHTFLNGTVRPKKYIAFVHVRTVEPANPNNPKYNKPRYRLLAFWQGSKPSFTKEDLVHASPIGGLAHIGGYIDTVWVDDDFKGSESNKKANIPNLYKALRKFAKNIGYPSLEPGDELTSKSYRAAQAKYDWKRAQKISRKLDLN